MAQKEAGLEPTVKSIVAKCPAAVLNPATGEVVDKKRVYDVLRNRCHDPDADQPWKHQKRLARKALTDATKVKRTSWSRP